MYFLLSPVTYLVQQVHRTLQLHAKTLHAWNAIISLVPKEPFAATARIVLQDSIIKALVLGKDVSIMGSKGGAVEAIGKVDASLNLPQADVNLAKAVAAGTSAAAATWVPDPLCRRDERPLSQAATEFRTRIFEELQMFSIVSVLMAGMAFAPLVVPFGDTVITGPALDCLMICCYLSATLALLLTGLYARLATVLRYCPTGKYVIWYIYRFEPTFALMHIAFMCTTHLIIAAASAALWSPWKCQLIKTTGQNSKEQYQQRALAFSGNTGTTVEASECGTKGNHALMGLYITMGICVLYFLYTWANSLFCRHNGLCGILNRSSQSGLNIGYIHTLMEHCKDILTEQPFSVYTRVTNTAADQLLVSLGVHHIATSLDLAGECPFSCATSCFAEAGVAVRSKCCCCPNAAALGDSVIFFPESPKACWRNVSGCELHDASQHGLALGGAATYDKATKQYMIMGGTTLDMVTSFSWRHPDWAVKVAECRVVVVSAH